MALIEEGGKAMIPKFAIFDMDGTLLDSMWMWENVAKLFLLRHGVAAPADINQRVRNMSVEQAADYFRSLGVRLPAVEIVQGIHRIPAEWYQNEAALKPKAKAFVEKLHRAGTRLCVATATEEGCARTALKRVGLLDRFSFLLTCGGIGKGKDEPDIYLECARRFGAKPQDVLVFEDSLYCIRTARAAGFPVVGVRDTASRQEEDEIRKLCSAVLDFGEAPGKPF